MINIAATIKNDHGNTALFGAHSNQAPNRLRHKHLMVLGNALQASRRPIILSWLSRSWRRCWFSLATLPGFFAFPSLLALARLLFLGRWGLHLCRLCSLRTLLRLLCC